MRYIDSHAHVNFSAFKDDGREVLERAHTNSVGVINVGSQWSTSERAVRLAESYGDNVWAVIGVHPLHLHKQKIEYHDTAELPVTEIAMAGEDPDFAKYFELGKSAKVVAIGEVGLDYHHFEADDNIEALTKKQKEVLLGFIEVANRLSKPIAIHCWDAYSDLLEILKTYPVKKAGVVHSFIGSYKTARKFIELGYKIGLNGVVTYSDSFDRLIKEIDLEQMLLETDCPYLTPGAGRGERNEPLGVIQVAEHIAKIKGLDLAEVAKVTTQNTRALFNL
jgi:TatD DNase family protein